MKEGNNGRKMGRKKGGNGERGNKKRKGDICDCSKVKTEERKKKNDF